MATLPQDEIAWDKFLSQHKNSPQAEGFARSFFMPMNAISSSLEQLTRALDLDSAQGARLDLIGSIVGASRYMPQGITLAYFGFVTQASGRGFGQARMYHDGEALAQSYTAGDEEYRILIKTKIALNNGHGTAKEIEDAARYAFRAPTASARDAGPGHVELWIGRIPNINEGLGRVIPDILPRAAGVRISLVFWNPELPFGFKNNNHFGFGVGILARNPI